MALTRDPRLGKRIARYRKERDMSMSELAAKAKVSKGYLSTLENGEGVRPGGDVLYRIASALGVTMSDLLGKKMLPQATGQRPKTLIEFAAEHGLPEADIEMLAAIQFRGDRPKTKERWAHIYNAIRGSDWMDRKRA